MYRARYAIFCILVLSPAFAFAQPQAVHLAWDPAPGEVSGYRIQYSTISNSYQHGIDVGPSAEYFLNGLLPGTTYYFVVRSYNAAGHLSDPSNEVRYTTPAMPRVSRVVDLNSDGYNDIVWQNRSNGYLSYWHMNRLTALTGDYLTAVGGQPARVADLKWKVMGTIDMNRDDRADLLWQHDSGLVSVWYMAGNTQVSGNVLDASATSDPQWRIAATGDLDRDGFDDIIWQHAGNGAVAVWYMQRAQLRSGEQLVLAPENWKVVGAADFDQDGRLDLVWRHSTSGQVALWLMDNKRLLAGFTVGPIADTSWELVATADFTKDGRPDLLWQNRDGRLAAWIMAGTEYYQGVWLNPGWVADTNWRIVGPR